MDDQEHLATLAGRLATFDGPIQVPKRRASALSKKKGNTVEWPHKTPSADSLAKAGFYYNPKDGSDDNVTCFHCNANVEGWEKDDNPVIEHVTHRPLCGWAINTAIFEHKDNSEMQDEDPMSEKMIEARTSTFKDTWPHEKKRGWKCKVKKMVEAGWCYNPTSPGDDFVTCFYCGLSLDGWEPKDDPILEHMKRNESCSFFSLKDLFDQQRPANKKTKSGRASKASRTSKASRISTQSSFSVSEFPSVMDLEGDDEKDDEPAEEGDTIMTTDTTTSRKGRSRKRADSKAKPAAARATKSKRGKKKDLEAEVDEEEKPEETSTDVAIVPEAEELVTNEIAAADDVDAEVAPAPKVRSKRTTNASRTKRNRKDEPDNSVMDTSTVEESAVVEQKPAKPKRKTAKKAAEENVEEPAVEASAQEEVDVPEPTKAKSSKSKRGTKRLSDGSAKLDDSVMISEPPAQPPAEVKTKKKTKSTATKPRQTKKKASEVQAETMPETQTDDAQAQEDVMEDVDLDQLAPVAVEKKAAKSRAAPKAVSEVSIQIDTDPFDEAHAPLPSQQTPQKAKQVGRKQAEYSPAQSSDAENQPPSSRPSLDKHDMRTLSPVVGARTPPVLSPTRRDILGGLQTGAPWKAIDLERAFLLSPSSKRLGMPPSLSSQDLTVESVLKSLTSPEKKMTVEQWIAYNSEQAEKQLRQECEQMIAKFESEGVKALQSLEGVETS